VCRLQLVSEMRPSPTAGAYPLVSTTSTIHLEEPAYTKPSWEERRIFGAIFATPKRGCIASRYRPHEAYYNR